MYVNNISVREMKRRNREAGWHFFDEPKNDKRLIEISPDHRGYFVTSEPDTYGNKIYAIRVFISQTGKVETAVDRIKSKELAKFRLSKLRSGY